MPAKTDALIEFCRKLPGATEDIKWGKDLIFSVGGKMFAGFQLPDGEPLAFKVEPPVFQSMTGKNGVIPAPYMAKHSWISVTERKRVAAGTLKKLLKDSHRLIAEKLPVRTRAKLGLDLRNAQEDSKDIAVARSRAKEPREPLESVQRRLRLRGPRR